MMTDRRKLMALLPAVIAQCAVLAAVADTAEGQSAATTATASDAKAEVLPSAVYDFDKLPVKISAGATTRAILKGKLATGESLEVHETTLPPGGAPHPPHHHEHTEMWLIREGSIVVTIEGKSQHVEAGGLAFVKSNEEHGITNPSDKSTTYFVVAVGPGAAA